MANVLHRTDGLTFPYRKTYRTSVNTPEFSPAEWIINPDLSAVQGFDSVYWNISGDSVTLANPAQRAARDAEFVAANALLVRESEKAEFDQRQVLKALVVVLLDEINTLRALHGLAARTPAQARAALRSAIDGGV